jgi:plastocyanin
MSKTPRTRRRVLVGGLTGLSVLAAGCLGDGDNENGNQSANGNESTNGNESQNGNESTNGNESQNGGENGTENGEENGGENGTENATPPETGFEFEYDQESEELTITVAGGDSFDPTRVSLIGNAFPDVGATWAEQSGSEESVTSGDTLTITDVNPAFLLDLVWTHPDTGDQTTLDATEGPEADRTPPETEFEIDYSQENQEIAVTVAGGDPFDPTQVTLDGNGFDGAGTRWAALTESTATVTVGETLTLTGVEPDFFLNVFWVPIGRGAGESLAMESGPGPDNGGNPPQLAERANSYLQSVEANGYDGIDDIVDATGQETVTIENGPGGDARFDPPAVRIDTGTTVTWEWESDGHSVSARRNPGTDQFGGAGSRSQGATYEWTFDTAGLFTYFSGPGMDDGHHGVVIIE